MEPVPLTEVFRCWAANRTICAMCRFPVRELRAYARAKKEKGRIASNVLRSRLFRPVALFLIGRFLKVLKGNSTVCETVKLPPRLYLLTVSWGLPNPKTSPSCRR